VPTDTVDTPTRTPGVDEMFTGYVVSTFTDGRLATPQEILDPQAPVGIFGIAGGGVGAGFAAERAASYAPGLNIRGSALEGMVVDQRNFFRGSDGSLGSGFVFATLLGLEPKYPETDLNSHCARCSPQRSRRRSSPSSSTSTMTTCSAPRVRPRRRPC